nr:PREDICTED: uncharacterized protein LOC107080082 [Lepisosteus oculatus]
MAGPGRGAGALSTVWLCLLLAGPNAGCFTCLVETGVGQRLCWGYVLPNSIRSMDACYRTLERIFGDERVIEAGRVVKELAVPERNRTVLRCEVGFSLPQDLQISWKFARQVRTQNTEQFEELTLGTDRIYAIPSTRPAQEGTYLCEIFTQERSIARVYYHLTVLSQDPGGPAELQRVFDTALLSPAQSEGPPPPPALRPPGPTEGLLSALLHHTSPPLLTACLSMMVLLLLVSLGRFVYWWSTQRGGRKLDWPRGAARHVEKGGG